MISPCVEWKKKQTKIKQNQNKLTDTDDKLVVTRGEGGKKNW